MVDGLGGAVKRAVWRYVRSGHVHISIAKEYANVAEKRNPKIHVQFIAQEVIDQIKPQLDAQWEGVLSVPKTYEMHCIIPKGKDTVMVSDISDSKEYTIVPIRKHDMSCEEEETVSSLDISQQTLDESEGHPICAVSLCWPMGGSGL